MLPSSAAVPARRAPAGSACLGHDDETAPQEARTIKTPAAQRVARCAHQDASDRRTPARWQASHRRHSFALFRGTAPCARVSRAMPGHQPSTGPLSPSILGTSHRRDQKANHTSGKRRTWMSTRRLTGAQSTSRSRYPPACRGVMPTVSRDPEPRETETQQARFWTRHTKPAQEARPTWSRADPAAPRTRRRTGAQQTVSS